MLGKQNIMAVAEMKSSQAKRACHNFVGGWISNGNEGIQWKIAQLNKNELSTWG